MRASRGAVLACLLGSVACALPGHAAGIDLRRVFVSAFQGSAIAAAWGDYDGDGRPDLAVAGDYGGVQLYRNSGASGFTQMSHLLGPSFIAQVMGVSWVDVDNDGDMDLFATVWLGGHRLYINDGKGGFLLDLANFELSESSPGMSAAWSDANADGWPDVVLASGGGAFASPARFLLGSPGGRFKAQPGDVADSRVYGAAVAWGDYDGDGDPDVVLPVGGLDSNLFFINPGDGGLDRQIPSPLVAAGETSGGTSCAWGDYDNDGDLDLQISSGGYGDALYRNNGNRTFTRVLALRDQLQPGATVGVVWSDFDNDGWLDLLVANRTGQPFVLRNLGNGRFVRVTGIGITSQDQVSNGVAVGDYNGDGYPDVALANWPNGSTVLYANQGGTNHWLRVRLEGTWSTRSGLGARVRATATLGGRRMTLLRQIGGEDGWATQEILAHFGLGDATQVESLSVEWPSGAVSTLHQVGVDQTLTVSEQATADFYVQPRPGVYPTPFQVTFFSGIAGGEIRYTTDGSEPSISSPRFTGPFTVATTTTVKAQLFLNGAADSAVREFRYRIDSGLRIEPPAGIFTNSIRVTLVSSLPDTVIRFTLNGQDPTEASTIYREPLRLSETTEVRVRSFVGSAPASGIVRAVFRRLYVTVVDGIPADWRRRYFGEDFVFDPRAMAAADPDFDGTSNLQEFLVGTDPLDPKSGIRAGIRMLAEIRFETVAGVKYRVLRSNAVTGVRVVVAEGIVGTGEVMTWVDSESPPANSFYVIDPVM